MNRGLVENHLRHLDDIQMYVSTLRTDDEELVLIGQRLGQVQSIVLEKIHPGASRVRKRQRPNRREMDLAPCSKQTISIQCAGTYWRTKEMMTNDTFVDSKGRERPKMYLKSFLGRIKCEEKAEKRIGPAIPNALPICELCFRAFKKDKRAGLVA